MLENTQPKYARMNNLVEEGDSERMIREDVVGVLRTDPGGTGLVLVQRIKYSEGGGTIRVLELDAGTEHVGQLLASRRASTDTAWRALAEWQARRLSVGVESVLGGFNRALSPTPGVPSCVICLDAIAVGSATHIVTPCAHHFHRQCLDRWVRIDPSCPLCKHSLHRAYQAA
jgi:hypothetical protein